MPPPSTQPTSTCARRCSRASTARADFTAALFDLVTDEAYYQRPISPAQPDCVLRRPHLGLRSQRAAEDRAGPAGIDDELERLFARGIDPEDETALGGRAAAWPSRDRVRAFVAEADRRLRHALQHDDLVRPGHRLLDRAEAVYTAIEHEELHQETLHYIWHRLPASAQACAGRLAAAGRRRRSRPRRGIAVDAGRATLGVARDAVALRLGQRDAAAAGGCARRSSSTSTTSPTPSTCEFVERRRVRARSALDA